MLPPCARSLPSADPAGPVVGPPDRASARPERPAPARVTAGLLSGHVGSHTRYCEGCRCRACRAAHAGYFREWRAGRIPGRVDTGPVRAHLRALVASGLVLGHLADEAGVPRRTVYGVWHGAGSTAPGTAAALLGLRPLRVAAALPARVRELDALAEARGDRAARRRAVDGLDLAGPPAVAAAGLGVSRRTVHRWRAAQAAADQVDGVGGRSA